MAALFLCSETAPTADGPGNKRNEMPDDQQQQGQQNTGDATGQQQGANTGAGQQGNGGSGDDKKFTQAELDAIVKDRLDRERKAADTKAQKDREAANADALKEQSKFKELAEQREKQLADMEPFKTKAERYELALTAHLTAERKNLPAHITALLDKLDPADQLEWIAANREALGKADDGKKADKGTPQTPKPNGKAQPTAEENEQVRQRVVASGNYPRF